MAILLDRFEPHGFREECERLLDISYGERDMADSGNHFIFQPNVLFSCLAAVRASVPLCNLALVWAHGAPKILKTHQACCGRLFKKAATRPTDVSLDSTFRNDFSPPSTIHFLKL